MIYLSNFEKDEDVQPIYTGTYSRVTRSHGITFKSELGYRIEIENPNKFQNIKLEKENYFKLDKDEQHKQPKEKLVKIINDIKKS